jgi:hypothetical protein
MMYAMAEQTDGCVKDPAHLGPDLESRCGFQGVDDLGCEPLNGCGVNVTFPFWLLFTCMVTFVVLNVFVAVILEAFEDSADAEEAKLTDRQWEQFCETWYMFVDQPVKTVADVFKMDMNNLLKFFKQLPEPMGFRRDDGTLLASDKSLTVEIRQMDINTVQVTGSQGLWAEFSNVAVACAKRVLIAAQNGQIDQEQLMADFVTAEKIESKASGRSMDMSRKGMQVQLNAKQYFAALQIAFAFRSHKFREKVRHRVDVNYDSSARSVQGRTTRSGTTEYYT